MEACRKESKISTLSIFLVALKHVAKESFEERFLIMIKFNFVRRESPHCPLGALPKAITVNTLSSDESC